MSNPRAAAPSSYISAIVKVAVESAETGAELAILNNLKNGFLTHDFILLCNTMHALNELQDKNNNFRQVVGKAAAEQFLSYLFGFIETSLLFGGSAYSLATGDYLEAMVYPVICYLAESLKKYLERIHKDEKVFDDDELREIRGCGLKAPYLSDIDPIGNTARIIRSTCNFVHSNFLFFKHNYNGILKESIVEPDGKERIGFKSITQV
jgi:hypothetical protein